MDDLNNLPKTYNPSTVEKKWYDYWLEKGYFAPANLTVNPSQLLCHHPM